MDDLRKKVIKGLKCLAGMNEMKSNPCMDCGYQECQTYAICIGEIARDAFTLLKAQEPRVMTLEEIKAWACKTGSQKDAVYIQNFNDPEFVWAYLGRFESDSGISQFDGYGYSWRCWTARPTDEQREKVKWE